MSSTNINADLNQRIAIDTAALPWQPSPSGTVWRKRLYLDGPVESGRVTSVVKYEPNASFPAHDHPQGEEILVLDGVFSDEHGDWPAGSYLLNPEGFRHAPFSRQGCLIFVRLRQYAGVERKHVAVCTDGLEWEPAEQVDIEVKQLYQQNGFGDQARIERWKAGTSMSISYPDGAELFIIQGDLQDDNGRHEAHSWIRLPAGNSYSASTLQGCEIFIRTALNR